MAYEEITAVLGGWPGFVVRQVTREPGGTRSETPQVTIALEPIPGTQRYCSRCGQPTTQVHDVAERRIRELPILDAETWLVLPLARVACPKCGPTVEALPWLDRYARMTKRFAASVARMPALVQFARHLKPKLAGILVHCRDPLHTDVLEGMNNKIKVLKRMAYGFRNDAYFFLKIRAAFPGNSR